MSWHNLQTIDAISTIVEASAARPQLIFKHSTRCGISAAARSRLEEAREDLATEMDLHYLDLISHRDVSNEIASRFSVEHQSPQILLIRDGASVLSLTHYDIEADKILQMVNGTADPAS
jgi:bacillithiol system protein YtxJ